MSSWFEADRKGLRKILRKRGIEFGVIELIQNALDEESTRVDVTLRRTPGNQRRFTLEVEDDNPEGFKDLSHAFTLFADSEKKDNPEQRGRFNLGEKLVLALCEIASISTVKGTINFNEGGRSGSRFKREAGSLFRGEIIMTKAEADQIEAAVNTVLPPETVEVYFNGSRIAYRQPLKEFSVQLPTLKADEEGNLTPTRRQTKVEVLRPLPGEKASIYEMGLPVVETGDKFHINVFQKVPLNMNRDNVTPAYLRELRAYVLNNTFDLLDKEEATQSWVTGALEDERVEPQAIEQVMTHRFGEKRVVFDPSDPEANNRAMSMDYTVIPGRAFPKAAWENIRTKDEATVASGSRFPTPKPFSPDGRPLKQLDPDEWRPGIRNIVGLTEWLAEEILGHSIRVVIANDFGWPHAAAFGPTGIYYYNVARLGYGWFEQGPSAPVLDLIIHEFGHEDGDHHLSDNYYNKLTKYGAAMVRLAIDMPEAWRRYE